MQGGSPGKLDLKKGPLARSNPWAEMKNTDGHEGGARTLVAVFRR